MNKSIFIFSVLIYLIICFCRSSTDINSTLALSIVKIDKLNNTLRKIDSTVYYFGNDKHKCDSIDYYHFVNQNWQSNTDFDSSTLENMLHFYKEKTKKIPFKDDYGVNFLIRLNSSKADYLRLKEYSDSTIFDTNFVEFNFFRTSENILYGHSIGTQENEFSKLLKTRFNFRDSLLSSLEFYFSSEIKEEQKYFYQNEKLIKVELKKYDGSELMDFKEFNIIWNFQ